jgi:hypothetical protein
MDIRFERKVGWIPGIYRRLKEAALILGRLWDDGVYFMEGMFMPRLCIITYALRLVYEMRDSWRGYPSTSNKGMDVVFVLISAKVSVISCYPANILSTPCLALQMACSRRAANLVKWANQLYKSFSCH